MRGDWRYTLGVLLVTAASLGTPVLQAGERRGSDEAACDAYTLEGLAPGMRYTEIEDILGAMTPRPRSAGKQRRYDADSQWQAVHSWHVAAGTLEVWYDDRKADRKRNPTAVRVRLLLPEDGMDVNALWKSVFDRFGPMSNWEREDCDIQVLVGMEKDRPHTTLSLMSWGASSNED